MLIGPSFGFVQIHDLDNLLDEAITIERFLSEQNPKTGNLFTEDYYHLAKFYFSSIPKQNTLSSKDQKKIQEQFPKVAFDSIIGQLKKLCLVDKTICQRAWQKWPNGKEFRVHAKFSETARTLNHKLWDEFLEGWLDQIHEDSGGLFSKQQAEAKTFIKNAKAEFTDLRDQHQQQMLLANTKKEQNKLYQAFYKQIEQNKTFQVASNYLLMGLIESEEISDIIHARQAASLMELFLNPQIIRDAFFKHYPELPSEFFDLVKKIVQKTKMRGQKLQKLFPRENLGHGSLLTTAEQVDVIIFKPLSRRFHSFFKGLRAKECVGGCAQNDALTDLTPRRWATGIIDKSQFYHLESKTSGFQGFLQLVPMAMQESGAVQTFASMDLGSPIFARSTTCNDTVVKCTFFDQFVQVYHKLKPASWQLALGDHDLVRRNYGTTVLVNESWSATLAASRHFFVKPEHIDPLVKSIEMANKQFVMGDIIGDTMIHELSHPNSKMLRVIAAVDLTNLSLDKLIKKLQSEDDLYIKRDIIFAIWKNYESKALPIETLALELVETLELQDEACSRSFQILESMKVGDSFKVFVELFNAYGYSTDTISSNIRETLKKFKVNKLQVVNFLLAKIKGRALNVELALDIFELIPAQNSSMRVSIISGLLAKLDEVLHSDEELATSISSTLEKLKSSMTRQHINNITQVASRAQHMGLGSKELIETLNSLLSRKQTAGCQSSAALIMTAQ